MRKRAGSDRTITITLGDTTFRVRLADRRVFRRLRDLGLMASTGNPEGAEGSYQLAGELCPDSPLEAIDALTLPDLAQLLLASASGTPPMQGN